MFTPTRKSKRINTNEKNIPSYWTYLSIQNVHGVWSGMPALSSSWVVSSTSPYDDVSGDPWDEASDDVDLFIIRLPQTPHFINRLNRQTKTNDIRQLSCIISKHLRTLNLISLPQSGFSFLWLKKILLLLFNKFRHFRDLNC